MAGGAIGVGQLDGLAASGVIVAVMHVGMVPEVPCAGRGLYDSVTADFVCGCGRAFVCAIRRGARPGELERQQDCEENEQQAAHGQRL